jgi:hypothetical protein
MKREPPWKLKRRATVQNMGLGSMPKTELKITCIRANREFLPSTLVQSQDFLWQTLRFFYIHLIKLTKKPGLCEQAG